jgi:HSP90 family molecular chaperone
MATSSSSSVHKPTKMDNFYRILSLPDVQNDATLKAFVEHEIDLLAKKSSSERKPTAQQMENRSIADAIEEFLSDHPTQLYTITELIKEVPACAELTNQRVTAIMRPMVESNRVEKIADKKKSLFRIAQG